MRRGEPLTRTEREVVDLVCEGLSNPEVAERLGVSARTVQGHLRNVFKKFGVATRTQLLARALRGEIEVGKGTNVDDPGQNGPKVKPLRSQEVSTSTTTTAAEPKAPPASEGTNEI